MGAPTKSEVDVLAEIDEYSETAIRGARADAADKRLRLIGADFDSAMDAWLMMKAGPP